MNSDRTKTRHQHRHAGRQAQRSTHRRGVIIRPLITHPDERGTLTEIYNPAWGISDLPMVYAYQSTIRPGKIKGWIEHHLQCDRVFPSQGHMRWVLYDNRPDSPTYRLVNEIFITEINRSLIVIPPYVFHAVQNVGMTDAVFINLPSRPYDHANPDKFRLPLNNDVIPFRFDTNSLGW